MTVLTISSSVSRSPWSATAVSSEIRSACRCASPGGDQLADVADEFFRGPFGGDCCSTAVCSSYILTMACDQSSNRGPSSAGTPSRVQITATEYGCA